MDDKESPVTEDQLLGAIAHQLQLMELVPAGQEGIDSARARFEGLVAEAVQILNNKDIKYPPGKGTVLGMHLDRNLYLTAESLDMCRKIRDCIEITIETATSGLIVFPRGPGKDMYIGSRTSPKLK